MDTQSLIAEAKARFNHNSAKHYLKEKFSSKLLVAEQNGLWRADLQTIAFLSQLKQEKIVMIDLYDNPVEVDVELLFAKLSETYNDVMTAWHREFKDLENKR